MDDDALAEALRTLRAADELRRILPLESRDRRMIEAHIAALDHEIRRLLVAPGDENASAAVRERSRETSACVHETLANLSE